MNKYSIVFLILILPISGFAADITEKLSISGTETTVYQWLDKSRGDVPNKDRGSTVIDFNVSFRPTDNDEFFIRASFAKGSGFHSESSLYPFTLNPNADDLFVDSHNINGHSRDHLQELWYAHKFNIKEDISLKLTAGIIDSTAFIDDNAYAADEITQFMNEAFVHNPLANLPSYDAGVAAEFETGDFHIKAVGMNSKNDYDRDYNYFALQLGYKFDTEIGEGNYRIYGFTTNKKFDKWQKSEDERLNKGSLKGIGSSFDQQLIKDVLGAFFRAGWQDDSAQIDYNKMVSFGLNLNGSVWGRKDDEVGIGYAYLKSPSKAQLKKTNVFESYVKFKLFSYNVLNSDITLDYQYIQDKYPQEKTNAGHIYGLRFNVSF